MYERYKQPNRISAKLRLGVFLISVPALENGRERSSATKAGLGNDLSGLNCIKLVFG